MTDQVDRAALEFLAGEYEAATDTMAELINRAMSEDLPREEIARMATDSFVLAIRAMATDGKVSCFGKPQTEEHACMVAGIEHELANLGVLLFQAKAGGEQ